LEIQHVLLVLQVNTVTVIVNKGLLSVLKLKVFVV